MFQYFKSALHWGSSDTADITERIQGEAAIRLMNKQYWAGTIDIRRRLYQAIVVNIALWGAKAERQTGPSWKRFTMDVSARCAG
jgi:hypothetical protein